ncbi:MAG: hypothetical protein D6741_03430, partial [Planctomycetota bacterium]
MSVLITSVILAAASAPGEVFAYNPPIDTVAGVTVRIDGPPEIDTIAEPFTVKVIVENRSESALRGRIRPAVIDDWSAEPAEADLTTAAGETATLTFSIRPGKATYNGWYPVHIFATGKLGETPWT